MMEQNHSDSGWLLPNQMEQTLTICTLNESSRHFPSNATIQRIIPSAHEDIVKKRISCTPSKGSVMNQNHKEPLPAQPSEASPRNMHIE